MELIRWEKPETLRTLLGKAATRLTETKPWVQCSEWSVTSNDGLL